MKSYVYEIRNVANGMLYIGKSVNPNRRWKYHRSAANNGFTGYLYNAMRSHGLESFRFEVVAECDSDEQALQLERELILDLKSSERDSGYNISSGGEIGPVGFRHTEDAKTRISQALRMRVVSDETRARLSKSLTGMKCGALSAEHRAQISACHRGRKQSPEWIAKRITAARESGAYTFSEERLAKMSNAAKGRRHTEEHKAHMSKLMKGRKYTPEQIETYRVAAKRREDRNRCAKWFCQVMAGVEL